jgi:hypothetical protein
MGKTSRYVGFDASQLHGVELRRMEIPTRSGQFNNGSVLLGGRIFSSKDPRVEVGSKTCL